MHEVKIIEKENRRGPKRKKDERLYVMIPGKTKEKYQKLLEKQGTNVSVKTLELIIEYIKENEKDGNN